MRRPFALLFVMLTTVSVWSQEKIFTLSAELNPGYSIPIIKGSNSIYTEGVQPFNRWKLGLNGSLQVNYRLDAKKAFSTGLGFYSTGEWSDQFTLIYSIDPVTGAVIQDPSLPNEVQFLYTNSYAEIPLMFEYAITNSFFVDAGGSVLINIVNRTTSYYYYQNGEVDRSSSIDNSTSFRPVNFNANLGIGWNYFQGDGLKCYLKPYYQLGILGVSSTATINRSFHTAGLVAGFEFIPVIYRPK